MYQRRHLVRLPGRVNPKTNTPKVELCRNEGSGAVPELVQMYGAAVAAVGAERTRATLPAVPVGDDGRELRGWLRRAWENGVPEGQRNKTLHRLALEWTWRGLPLEETEERAFEWGLRCSPPYTAQDEIRRTVRSAHRWALTHPPTWQRPPGFTVPAPGETLPLQRLREVLPERYRAFVAEAEQARRRGVSLIALDSSPPGVGKSRAAARLAATSGRRVLYVTAQANWRDIEADVLEAGGRVYRLRGRDGGFLPDGQPPPRAPDGGTERVWRAIEPVSLGSRVAYGTCPIASEAWEAHAHFVSATNLVCRRCPYANIHGPRGRLLPVGEWSGSCVQHGFWSQVRELRGQESGVVLVTARMAVLGQHFIARFVRPGMTVLDDVPLAEIIQPVRLTHRQLAVLRGQYLADRQHPIGRLEDELHRLMALGVRAFGAQLYGSIAGIAESVPAARSSFDAWARRQRTVTGHDLGVVRVGDPPRVHYGLRCAEVQVMQRVLAEAERYLVGETQAEGPWCIELRGGSGEASVLEYNRVVPVRSWGPTLVLDGTGDEELVRHIAQPGGRVPDVRQVGADVSDWAGRGVKYQDRRWGISGLWPYGADTPAGQQYQERAARDRELLADEIVELVRTNGHKRPLILTWQRYEQWLRDVFGIERRLAEVGAEPLLLHFYGQRGRRDAEDCDAAFIVGYPSWPPDEVARLSRAFMAATQHGEAEWEDVRGRIEAQGSWSEAFHAAHRIRPVYRDAPLYVFTSEALPRVPLQREWPLELTAAQRAVAEVMGWCEEQGAPGLSVAVMGVLRGAAEAVAERGTPEAWAVVLSGGRLVAVVNPIRAFLIGRTTATQKLPKEWQLRKLMRQVAAMAGWSSTTMTVGEGQQPTVYHPQEVLDQARFLQFQRWVTRECSEAIDAEQRLPEVLDTLRQRLSAPPSQERKTVRLYRP